MNFEYHINTTVSKVLKVIGFINRNTSMFRSANCLRTLYFALVRSILEYGSIIWHPYLTKDVIRLERVQNRFLSYAAYLLKIEHPRHDYLPIRSNLSIPLLSTRRSDADHKFISSVLSGSLDVPEILSEVKLRVPSHSTRIHTLFFVPPHTRPLMVLTILYTVCSVPLTMLPLIFYPSQSMFNFKILVLDLIYFCCSFTSF